MANVQTQRPIRKPIRPPRPLEKIKLSEGKNMKPLKLVASLTAVILTLIALTLLIGPLIPSEDELTQSQQLTYAAIGITIQALAVYLMIWSTKKEKF